jgi:hypothetical protein
MISIEIYNKLIENYKIEVIKLKDNKLYYCNR